MLSRLLDLLREGGTRRVSGLARELGTTPELVAAMLADLVRMGYVKRVNAQCSEKCKTCPLYEKGCRVSSDAAGGSPRGRNGGRVWVLVEQQDGM
jgi:Mn-dependent DtxR family transcriptional regulator